MNHSSDLSIRAVVFALATLVSLPAWAAASKSAKKAPAPATAPDFRVKSMTPYAATPQARAAEEVEEVDAQEGMTPFEFTSRFTVKITNHLANIFSGAGGGGHGTGFFIGTKKDKNGVEYGIVFTNNHVVSSSMHLAQKLTIDFTTDTDIPEEVNAEIEYQSEVHDFSVLLFKMDDVKRVRGHISPAPLPGKDSPFYDFAKYGRQLQGRKTLAQGNPFDSEASITFGNISTVYRDMNGGVYIQTQTPINPGNSGGPLIDLEAGLVIGINTLKNTDADNIGFSIPIGVVMSEYEEWLKNPDIGRTKAVDVRLGTNPKSQTDVLGVSRVIQKTYPDFFNHYSALLRIQDAAPSSNLRTGDQIVKVNGHFLTSSMLVYEWLVQEQLTKGSMKVELVRNGKLINVEVPVRDGQYQDSRSKVDFVYMSGLLFNSVSENLRWRMNKDINSHVLLGQIIPNAEINFGAMRIPDNGSLLVSVNLNDVDYPIRNLSELRRVLYKNRGVKFIRLDVREPVKIYDNDGGHVVTDGAVAALAYRSTIASYVVPLTEVLGPMQFSVHRFMKQFSFAQGQPETRDWRRGIHADRLPSFCDSMLAKKTPPTTDEMNPEDAPVIDARGRHKRLPPVKD